MYYNKVDISGVDTSGLAVLKESEKIELLKKCRAGDKQAREKLISGNLRLVLSVIQKFMGRGENPDDLFQVGCIGLIKAIDNFNTELDVRFSTYAVPMISGELKRYLRDNTPIRISRSLRDLAYRAMQAKEMLTAKLSREPDITEIAAELGVPKADVVTALESISDPVSLYEPVYSDAGDTLYVLDQIGDGNDSDGWIDELSFKEALVSLNEREKKILYLRFLRGHTQMEVAREIGISQAQVSRLEKNTLDKIKGC
ncbi:MAG: RNA polymerase sporulation sigma factor SigG [Oscillospiraceae bacterium]|nr:RNA polymerase sporulation sigma factor SigG [Oscillospiraceae bacterium]MDD7279179.1 RNA polymerase sporulation sigma factor SigG [Oscillospiraceae bacterium]MDY2864392.1 RNA polymerase sporulation sigma factor SigG [Oscillospiraceae bacterium]